MTAPPGRLPGLDTPAPLVQPGAAPSAAAPDVDAGTTPVPPGAPVAGRLTRWRLDLAYDGTDFRGWAAQPGLRTVQGTLEDWTARVLRLDSPARLVVAGRTDAGVHARAQVAHLDLPEAWDSQVDGGALARRLARVLPADIAVRSVVRAPDGFDARFSAIWRRYCYRLWDGSSQPDPLLRRQATALGGRLDLDAMNAAAASLLGLRDFAPFCRRREGATSIRTLQAFTVVRAADACGTIEAWVQADAFCHSMVRCLVGALVTVGSGRRDLAWLARVANRTVRCGDVPALPAGGLTLEQVGYPPDAELAGRARQARCVRTLEGQREGQP